MNLTFINFINFQPKSATAKRAFKAVSQKIIMIFYKYMNCIISSQLE